MRLWFSLLLFSTGLFISCETDFEVNAEWKDISVVYCLLNQQDSAHYVKINKAYLGEGDALTMAGSYDSINYSQTLDVILQEWNGGSIVNTLVCLPDASIPKDPGLFSAPAQVLYKTKGALNPASEYRLIIRNSETGKSVTGSTPIIDPFSITKPSTSPGEKVSWATPTPYKVAWNSAVDGKLYQLTIRFHYRDSLLYPPNTVTPRYIDWVLPARETASTDGKESLTEELPGDNFYTFVASQLQANSDVARYAGNLDFIIDVAGEDFNTYMKVNRPSTGIVQEKPEFTNLENAIGIFSCRYWQMVPGKEMNLTSLDSLRDGRYTKHLGFR